MAANGVNKLKLLLVYGNQKVDTEVALPEDETGDVLTVKHLAETVAKKMEVPVSNQKLIFKGKSLTDPAACLTTLGMKNGSKVMLIGKKFNPEDDSHMQHMKKLSDEVGKTEKKLSDVIYEMDGIKRGYLASELHQESLDKLSKRLMVVMEEFTRHLETLDGMALADSASEVRMNRKSIVTRVQSLLDRCDNIQSGMVELQSRVGQK